MSRTGKCPLCLNVGALAKSHVIAACCYRPLLDETRTLRRVEVDDGVPVKEVKRQSGAWDVLLCGDCERRLSVYETYFALTWFEHPVLPPTLPDDVLELRDLNYSKFKLFHLANLWRAHHSKYPDFAHVDIGPHAERLRVRLLEGEPGPETEYAISGFLLVDDARQLVAQNVSPYVRFRVAGLNHYTVVYAGCQWTVQVSRGAREFPYLRQAGSIIMPVQAWASNSIIKALNTRHLKDLARAEA